MLVLFTSFFYIHVTQKLRGYKSCTKSSIIVAKIGLVKACAHLSRRLLI